MSLPNIKMSHPATVALVDYILSEYPKDTTPPFSTSWTTYAITTTHVEDLVDNFYAAHLTNPEDVEWIKWLPIDMIVVCHRHIARLPDQDRENKEDAASVIIAKFSKFVGDAVSDLFECNVRDETNT